ncbi:MAG: deoxyribodipyrimidine photo-lyase [Candidatus Limnocylindrales bacterium]
MSTTRGRASIVWFRRDLRLHDHPALLAACADSDEVVPLYILDPTLINGRFASPNRTWFLLESVRALRLGLRELGSDLVVRVGDPREIVVATALATGADAVYLSRDHAPFGRARDAAVAATLASAGIAWHPRRGGLVQEPDEVRTGEGGSFTVYSPFRRAWEVLERRAVRGVPDHIPALPAGMGSGPIPSQADLGAGAGPGPTADANQLPKPGEPAARRRLERWVSDGIQGYASQRDRMDLVGGTSRLSADLHLGLLSPTEVVESAQHSGTGDGQRRYANELVWREFYAHVLFHRPSVRTRAFREEYESIPWSDDDAALAAWQHGRTGYPIVDAGMRQLTVTGWMHNRARMITASFLTKDLLIDWRRGESHFMRHLVDGDVASNNGGWQWSASTGTDPQPYFRIFNPILQGKRFDPDGDYVRRWVPELARVRTGRIHAPWEMSDAEQAEAGCRIGLDYPAPIVDHGEARARALAVYEAARRTS